MTRSGNGNYAVTSHSILIPASRLHPHPWNIRESLGDLSETTATIKRVGLLQPLTVIPNPDLAGAYYVVAGHRRLVAGQRAGLKEFPCTVRQMDPESPDVTELMLVENCQRRELNSIEKAKAMGRLRDEGDKTSSQIARAVGMSDATVCNYLALLELDDASQERVREGSLPVAAAVQAVRKTRAKARKRAGHSDQRKSMALTWEPDHFTDTHPLARKAGALCDAREHNARRRIGPACGACWEVVIRDDQTVVVHAAGNGSAKPPEAKFATP